MPTPGPLQFTFPGLSPSEAGRDAALLTDLVNKEMREAGANPAARQVRTDPDAADLGTLVQIVLAAPASIILARGIAKGLQAYMARTNRGSVIVTKPDGTTVTVTGLESRDADKVVGKLGLG